MTTLCAIVLLLRSCIMVVRTAWVSCTAVLLSLSLGTANGPSGGFFFPRHQQRSRKLLADQVQQPHLVLGTPASEERLGGLRGGLDRAASIAAVAFGRGAAQAPRKAAPEAAQSYHEDVPPQAEVPGVEQQCQQGTHAGFGRQWRGLSSPLEALSSTSRRLGMRASSTVATLGLREGRQRSATLLTRGGGAPQPARPSATPPPHQGDRWENAIEGLKNGLASGLAAACVKTVLQPFDTMKTVQQFSTTRWVKVVRRRRIMFGRSFGFFCGGCA